MNELSHLAMESPNVWVSVLLTILGMLLYWMVQLKKVMNQKKDAFDFNFWFMSNHLDLWISLIGAAAIFIASHSSGTLTMERCLFMGLTVSFMVNKLMQITVKS